MSTPTNKHSATHHNVSKLKIAVGISLVLLIVVIYWYLGTTGRMKTLCNCDSLHELIGRLGVFGPLAVIGLMAAAIVMSPIPSAPIALAAGMAYGHGWGTLYIVIGSELGALIAFTLARLLGYEVLHKWFGGRLEMGLLGSQTMLMFIVFIGRLLPFISFDILSYAAGLTALAFWRFAIATLAGIIPISFLIAHFGSELGSADIQKVTTTMLVLGSVTLIPVAVKWIHVRRRKETAANAGDSYNSEKSR